MLATLGLVILLAMICVAGALVVGLLYGFLVAVALAWCSVVVPAIAFAPLFLIALAVLDDPTRAFILSGTVSLVIAIASPVLHYRVLHWWWHRGERAELEKIAKAMPEWRAAADRSIVNFRNRLLDGETERDLSWTYSQALARASTGYVH
jgi:hypothetical protein